MAEIDDKEAYQIHGTACSDSDSDIDGKGELDEEYNMIKYPPLDLDEENIVAIHPQSSEQLTETRNENSMTQLPKKNKNSTSSKVTNDVELKVEAHESEDMKENVPPSINTLPASVESNSVDELQTKEPKTDISDKTNISETSKENERPAPENSELENADIFEKVTFWDSDLRNTSPAEETNLLLKEEGQVKMKKKKQQKQSAEGPTSCTNVSNEKSGENDMKGTSEDEEKEEEKTNENSTESKDKNCQAEVLEAGQTKSVPEVPNSVPPKTSTGNHEITHVIQHKQTLTEGFKNFVQNTVRGGANVTDLNSFTYEQLRDAYMAHQQKARNDATGKGLVMRNPWVQHNVPMYRPVCQQTYIYPGNYNASAMFHQNTVNWQHPGSPSTNATFYQNNVNWPLLGNDGTNARFVFYPNPSRANVAVPMIRAASTSADTLELTEIKENEVKPQIAAATSNEQTRAERPETETKENSVTNGVQKTVTNDRPVTETLNVSSVLNDHGTIENDISNMKKKKKKQNQVAEEPLAGGMVLNASQGSVGEILQVKSVRSRENFFYSENFDKALNSFIQGFNEGNKILIEGTQAKKYISLSQFSQCKDYISGLLKVNDDSCLIIKRCLEICALICKEKNTNDPIRDVKRKTFAAEFERCGKILKEHIKAVLHYENKCLETYNSSYGKMMHHVFMMRAGLRKCSQTCDTIIKEIRKSGWIDVNESNEVRIPKNEGGRFVPRFGESEEDVQSSRELTENGRQTGHNRDSERLLLGLESPKDSLESSQKATDGKTNQPAICPLETKETVCGGRGSTDADILRENLTVDSLTTLNEYMNVNKFLEHLMYHLKGLDSDFWWCHQLFITLVAYILMAAVQGVLTFAIDHFLHVSIAFLIFIFLKNRE